MAPFPKGTIFTFALMTTFSLYTLRRVHALYLRFGLVALYRSLSSTMLVLKH